MEKNLRLECEKILGTKEIGYCAAFPLRFDSDDIHIATKGNDTRWFKVALVWETNTGRRRRVVRGEKSPNEVYAVGDWEASADND